MDASPLVVLSDPPALDANSPGDLQAMQKWLIQLASI